MNKLSIAGFTNLGYLAHSRSFGDSLPRMDGKTVVITGGSGGLGLASAETMSGLGARLIIVGRSESRLEAALDRLAPESIAMRADLSLLSEVDRLANELVSVADHIDVLVNNVGVLLPRREVTSEGLEKTLATNLAGHFALTNQLAPLLVASAPSRIVNVSSGGMYAERIKPCDLQFEDGEYRGTTAYARTKRGQVILTEMWAELFSGTGVVVNAMHPGWAQTQGVELSLPTFNKLMAPFLRSPAQGSDTITWLAASEDAARNTGRFWFDRMIVPTHLRRGTRETAEDRDELWGNLVELTSSDLTVARRVSP